MAGNDVVPVVIDNGSDTCKVGMAGDHNPKNVFPCVTGQGVASRRLIGQAALDKEDVVNLTYPVQRGVVTDWDAMEAVWRHVFEDILKVKPSEHPVLITETPKNPKENRDKMAEVLFEKFQVPALFVSCQAVLALYSAGRTTGMVLDIGSGVTTAVPVYEGYNMTEAVIRRDFAGADITESLKGMLAERGFKFETLADQSQLRAIKEKLCYVADSNKATSSPSKNASYKLPDGRSITLEAERHRCTEALFQPALCGKSSDPGVHQMISKAVSACEVDTRKSLYHNVILSGGSTLFDGMADRLRAELKAIGGQGVEARISSPKDRLLSAWSGGSVLASVSAIETTWIGRSEYQESGPTILHTKCF